MGKKNRAAAAAEAARRRAVDRSSTPVEERAAPVVDVSERLDALAVAVRRERLAIASRHAAARAARDAGATWTEIGRLLGVSAQAVQKRYGS